MKTRKHKSKIEGWDLSLNKNVHMYCHKLSASRGSQTFDIPCEDTPDGHIGVWLDSLDYPDSLSISLNIFFSQLNENYKIYNTEKTNEIL